MGDETSEPFDERLQRARAGDESVLNRLIEQQRSWLRRAADRALGREMRRWHDPSDVVQESLQRGRQSFRGFSGREVRSFRAWLKGIQNNVLNNLLRRDLGKLKHEALQLRDEQGERDFADSTGSLGRQFDRQQEMRWAKEAIAYLDDEDRRLLETRFLNPGAEQITYDQLASALGTNAPQLRQRVHRLVRRLAEGVMLLRKLENENVAQHYQQLLCWEHFRGWPAARIARELNWSEKAVTVMLANAHEQLTNG